MRLTASVRLALGVSLAALALPAVAQTGDQAEASAAAAGEAVAEEAPVTDDIIVTARRRAENLLDVPIAISAFTGDQLEAAGSIDITDLANITPNATLENSRGTNSTLTAFIRGVGQQDPVPGFEAGVGIYLDDVYLNRPQAAVLDIYDVERIEVLRGPQGTLYGRNTIGGAIKYVTRRLPSDFEVRVRATYGSYDQADGVISVSAPIGDMFRIGGSVARLSRGGFGDNINLGIENYNKDIWAGRGTLEFETPDSRLFIRLSGDYTDDQSNARNGHRLIPSLLTGAPVLEDEYDTRAGLNSPRNDVEAGGLSMSITAELSDALTFRSISAWRQDRSFTPIDFDALPTVDVDVPAVYRNEQVSQEFQLLYASDRLNGLVGFYYLDAEASTAFDVILATTGPLIGIPLAGGFGQLTTGNVQTDTWSFFGDFTYDLTDWLGVSVGGRYTRDNRTSTIFKANRLGGASPQFGGNGVNLGAPITNFRGEAEFEKFTPRASVQLKPTADLLVYASYSQGFKGGGFDPRGSANIAPNNNGTPGIQYDEIYDFFLFEPETVDSYEVGIKGSLFDRALTFGLTGFYADYTDVQVPGSVGVDANGDGIFEGFAGVTTNAASATFKGIEAEANARLLRGFAGPGSQITLGGTLGYIDAQYDEFIGNTGVDVSDFRRIQNTPDWTLSGTLGATAPIGSGSVDASTTVSYRSETSQFETPSPFLDQPGYALWDANLVYRFMDDRFSVGLHAKNILDERYITSGYQFAAANAVTGQPTITPAGTIVPSLGREGTVTAFYGNPRQVFVTLGARF
ncbi:iron complex outermembrane receptor protein [Sphingomonas jejuensis]|uniref:Iron complex outermembrane receptor protein n=1 Tax=Sphingomonas jejuensis TaxID=904715 RepID=A0ABX0XNZ4_9SPHN|nr:TonB-dependent receptor [Sphingomonas jejuensis]NJC34928.1 iron complex outermembrane receptor protein [Sphingomonas jejuensis]